MIEGAEESRKGRLSPVLEEESEITKKEIGAPLAVATPPAIAVIPVDAPPVKLTSTSPRIELPATPPSAQPPSTPRVSPPRDIVRRPPGPRCLRCNVYFPSEDTLKLHIAASGKHNICPRQSCGYDAKSKAELHRHYKSNGCGIPCNGCDNGYLTRTERDLHLMTVKACRRCHVHLDTWENFDKHDCSVGVIEKSLSSKSQKGVEEAPNSSETITKLESIGTRETTGTAKSIGIIETKAVVETIGKAQHENQIEDGDTKLSILQTQSKDQKKYIEAKHKMLKNYADAMHDSDVHSIDAAVSLPRSETASPEPFSQHQITATAPAVLNCAWCSSVHTCLSASLIHLEAGACPSGMSASKARKEIRYWYPWETATIDASVGTDDDHEAAVKTMAFEMRYYCPGCGAVFGCASHAVRHMEERADDLEDGEILEGGEGCANVLVKLWERVGELGNVEKAEDEGKKMTEHGSFKPMYDAEALKWAMLVKENAEKRFYELTKAVMC